ncbi:MAG: nucleotide exchange factor GrpE [Fimbriimonadaceae bacterium]|nr:nucleotide exchange factor GrpE [Fimbriimonadaceae bacterium]
MLNSEEPQLNHEEEEFETLAELEEEDELPIDDRDQLIRTLTDERDQLRDQLLRSVADLQTFRRRALAEKDEVRKYGMQDLVEMLLPVLDNFERTVRSLEAGADSESVMQGVGMIEKQLRAVLEGSSVQRIIAVGQPFDPSLHEAVELVPSSEMEPGTIVEELSPGYRIHERVIRPARVKVTQSK